MQAAEDLLRDRDTMVQERISLSEVTAYLRKGIQ
jgi:glycyl-tRNA synthetase (class II)